MMERISYSVARPRMKPGDVIAFSGKGHFSEIIKLGTRGPVSHVGVVMQTMVFREDVPIIHPDGRSSQDPWDARYFNEVIESTSLKGCSGVFRSRLSDRVEGYDGEIWWLPLAKPLHDSSAFFDFLMAQDRKPYDMAQAVGSALDAFDRITGGNREDFSKFFCSELVAAAFEAAGVVPAINASEVTPIDLCRMKIYAPDYYLLKGDEVEISRFNRLDPADWNF